MSDTKDVGNKGEAIAAAQLTALGYEILERNWRYDRAEADIVAIQGGDVVIIEVKTRRGRDAHNRALESITPAKQKTLRKLTLAYHAQLERDELGLRVDVAIVTQNRDGAFVSIYENAIEWVDG